MLHKIELIADGCRLGAENYGTFDKEGPVH
jgi:hypothetical protein